ncbi:uncharacterized protein FOMMEDRAFT_167914 [Fomitiporia mediterranea MF3/22]|uniref:uncharacterized protein n=1 Tax=Fomitiporia mediterranea (strain MF3/22) TaxID=694068 RepID=UPI0004408181|nr:uncharacterized protein FOMMEDRAFT_167914 [Fomitiporia mediterranea MF3/22]EJD02744.1 hypothetical protein FOMMEDRAFT_167914 [Fomitiporia mediterranea MF3/22]
MPSAFTAYLADHYAELRNLATQVGRRKAKLRLLESFWTQPFEEKECNGRIAEDQASHEILTEALEDILKLGGEEEAEIAQFVDEARIAGVVVRTDFSDDTAWTRFCETLMSAEKDLAMPIDEEGAGTSAADGEGESDESESESESDNEDEEMNAPGDASKATSASEPVSLFAILSPPTSSPLRARLSGISNLAALRLLNDVDAVRSPVPVPKSNSGPSSSAGHRLAGLHGFVEAYTGPLIWVYDARSNTDQAARVVSQCAEGVGSATGDSWRARASFLPELQLNLISGTMKIDFGGLDRWDNAERLRNMSEADSYGV